MKRIMIVDALNMYFRAYIVDPSLSTNGQPIGGLKGFMKILNKLVREVSPDTVVICWDGRGGSKKRKLVNKNYKEGRKPIRLNRSIRNLSESEEVANKIWQQTRLFEYLNEMPIIQLVSDGVEADDIIAYVANHPLLEDWEKVIVSSDKDFFQLLTDKTILYRPSQGEVLNKNKIVEKYGIHPTNFALARAVSGDKGDNLSGIQGVGLATLSKRFPFLSEEKTCEIDYLVKYCENQESNLKVYDRIVEGEDTIRLNYKLMQLYSPSISAQGRNKINHTLKEFTPELNKTEIRKMFIQDGIGELKVDELFRSFQKICHDHRGQE